MRKTVLRLLLTIFLTSIFAVCMTPLDRANFIIITFQRFARAIALHVTFVGCAPHSFVLPTCTRTSHSSIHILYIRAKYRSCFLLGPCITVRPIF